MTLQIIALDSGMASASPSIDSGCIIQISESGQCTRSIAQGLCLPDAVELDAETSRLFGTCMGYPGANDGFVWCSNIDGSNASTVLPKGVLNTPKQLAIDSIARKLYIADREGTRIVRCNMDGSQLETLVTAHDTAPLGNDCSQWCVGVAVAPKMGKFFWVQKGAAKSSTGRIFSADIETPSDSSSSARPDVKGLLENLPEPIHLALDEAQDMLYWTDRGDLPYGNSVNRAKLTGVGGITQTAKGPYEILVRHLNEAIGISLATDLGKIYFADLGGSIYTSDLDGKHKKQVYHSNGRAFTGIALVNIAGKAESRL